LSRRRNSEEGVLEAEIEIGIEAEAVSVPLVAPIHLRDGGL